MIIVNFLVNVAEAQLVDNPSDFNERVFQVPLPSPFPPHPLLGRICTGTGPTPPASAHGLCSPLPHLRRDWAHCCHICTGTGLTAAASALGLGSPLPRLRRGLGSPPATSAPGLGQVDPDIEEDVTQATKTITINQCVQVP